MGRGRPRYYVVEEIVDSKTTADGDKLYLIKWKDWSHRDNTWEPLKHLVHVEKMVRKFDKLHQARKEEKRRKMQAARRRSDNIMKTPRRASKEIRKVRIRPAKYIRIHSKPKFHKYKHTNVKLEENSQAAESKRCLLSRDKRLILQSQNSQLSTAKQSKPNNQISNSEDIQSSKWSERLLRKRHLIKKSRKIRLTRSLTAIRRKNKLLESKKQMRQCQTSQGYLKREEEEVEDVDIQQILLKCMQFQSVAVLLKNGELHYRIPYWKNNKCLYFETTSSEILKVNPVWLTNYFQGFYL